jgi:GNAT superfamily N-acetyltransferase
MEIVQCTLADYKPYQNLARQTFFESYETGTDPADLEKYMVENFSDEAITEEFNSSDCVVFLMKDKERGLLGYTKLRWDTTHELLKGKNIELQRIYVLKTYYGQGYGKSLIKHAEQYGRQKGFDWIWLCVWFENHGAIRFYEREGWLKFGDKKFKFGDHIYLDPVFRKKL